MDLIKEVTQIVELRSADNTVTDNLDLVDGGGMQRENFLHELHGDFLPGLSFCFYAPLYESIRIKVSAF